MNKNVKSLFSILISLTFVMIFIESTFARQETAMKATPGYIVIEIAKMNSGSNINNSNPYIGTWILKTGGKIYTQLTIKKNKTWKWQGSRSTPLDYQLTGTWQYFSDEGSSGTLYLNDDSGQDTGWYVHGYSSNSIIVKTDMLKGTLDKKN